MRERATLTAIWLGAFVVAFLFIELYIGKKDAAGLKVLLPEDRIDVLRPIALLYSGYLTGVLACWFARPFKAVLDDQARRIRFVIAVACTIIFNVVVLYLVGREHVWTGGNVVDDIHTAVKVAALMSFIVAPANLYYFGIKSTEA